MTAFFVPHMVPQDDAEEDAYAAICACAEAETGHPPAARRIFRLWSRRAGLDCMTEVGKPDPIHGETVLAILDLGRHLPYLVHCGRPGAEDEAIREIVSSHVYDVTEFGVASAGSPDA
ncbi:MAG: hypothetical protein JWQ48_3640 [Conexibacter sp.]|jgi:hypothetical protein|nr:hypothetical protein [Conexibacter sp.]